MDSASPLAATSSGEENSDLFDAGGVAVAIEDYPAIAEPQMGYLSLAKSDCVEVFAKTRTAGDRGNVYREYVYGYRRGHREVAGWLPCEVLKAGVADMQR